MWACFIIPCCLLGSVFSFLVRLCRHAPSKTFAPLSQKHDSTSWPQKNEPNKCAWEKEFRGRSCVLASSLTVFRWVFIFLSSHGTKTWRKGATKKSKSNWPVAKTNQGASQSNTNHNTTETKHHTSYRTLPLPSYIVYFLIPPLSFTFFFLLYSHHATSIRDWSQHHFLCGCSLLSSCQRATRAADDISSDDAMSLTTSVKTLRVKLCFLLI